MVNRLSYLQDIDVRTIESRFDSLIRIIGRAMLLYLGSDHGLISGTLALVIVILSTVLLLTGVVGFSPLYALFKSRRK